jgi:GNAT superfamily N-acetyltransferase
MVSNHDVPNIDVIFLEEVDCFLQWSSAVSRAGQKASEGIARWYEGEVFRAYVRIVPHNTETKECAVIRVSDMAVRPAYRGCGFFTMLMSAFNQDSRLPFDRIEVEPGANERFAAWLLRFDFEYAHVPGLTVVYKLLRRCSDSNASRARTQ